IIAIAIIGIALSALSYEYSYNNSQKIANLANEEIRSNSEIKAHDISKIIENKFETVQAVLSTLSTSPAVHNLEYARAHDVINLSQASTNDITDAYFWLDKNGK